MGACEPVDEPRDAATLAAMSVMVVTVTRLVRVGCVCRVCMRTGGVVTTAAIIITVVVVIVMVVAAVSHSETAPRERAPDVPPWAATPRACGDSLRGVMVVMVMMMMLSPACCGRGLRALVRALRVVRMMRVVMVVRTMRVTRVCRNDEG